MKSIRYHFVEVTNCEMCGDNTDKHHILGFRLNQSQGFSPKGKSGIAVSVKKCTKCDLIYSSPMPIPFDIQDHYGTPPEEYWKPYYFNWDPNYFMGQIKTVKEVLPFKEGMKALDIGAGLGKCMLSLSNSGFESYGLEPSKPFYERAITKMNISEDKLKLGMIEEVDYPDNTFDFITFGAVFEHLYHPAECLEKAMKWLKPKGIVHIEVPSSNYFISKLINRYFKLSGTNYVTNISPMHTPFHLYEFDLKSFEALGKRLKYKIEKHKYDVGGVMHGPKFLHSMLKNYMKKTNSGKQLTVYLRKE